MKAKPTDPRQRQGVGLDKPCSSCGQEIYFNYQGPFEGICGRCTDGLLARHRTTKRGKTVLIERRGGSRVRFLIVLVAFLAGAAVGLLLYPHLAPYMPF